MCKTCELLQLHEMAHGDHTCLIYSTMDEYRNVACTYIRDGLEKDELILCVIDEYADTQLIDDLRALQIHVDEYLEKGQLILSSIKDTYRGTQQFKPDDTLAYWKALVLANKDCKGIRIMGEATFALDGRYETLERLIDYEIRVNIELIPFFDKHQYLCVYNRNLYPAGILKSIIRSHPRTINGTQYQRKNPFFILPETYLQIHKDEVDLYDVFHIIQDSVHVNLEKELRIDQSRFRYILGSIGDGVWDYDAISNKLHISSDLSTQIGVASEDDIQQLEDFEKIVHPDDLASLMAEIRKHSGNVTAKIKQEIRLRTRTQDWSWYECAGKAIGKTENGQVSRIVGTFRDIHARKILDEERQNLNHELELRVAARTEQLLQANQELEAFSYSVSHDLRAPLRSIDGFSKALAQECAQDLNGNGVHYLDRIRNATSKMNQLINELLNLSRLNKSDMKRTVVDLSKLATAFIDQQKEQIQSREIVFEIQPDVMAYCDEGLMRIVFDNLLGNALKFTQKHDAARIRFGTIREADRNVFFVRDDGAGFDIAYADKLFGVFQRLHRLDEFEGNGIGLAIVQRVIHRHGGSIWAESQIEQGATFYFTLDESGGFSNAAGGS